MGFVWFPLWKLTVFGGRLMSEWGSISANTVYVESILRNCTTSFVMIYFQVFHDDSGILCVTQKRGNKNIPRRPNVHPSTAKISRMQPRTQQSRRRRYLFWRHAAAHPAELHRRGSRHWNGRLHSHMEQLDLSCSLIFEFATLWANSAGKQKRHHYRHWNGPRTGGVRLYRGEPFGFDESRAEGYGDRVFLDRETDVGIRAGVFFDAFSGDFFVVLALGTKTDPGVSVYEPRFSRTKTRPVNHITEYSKENVLQYISVLFKK